MQQYVMRRVLLMIPTLIGISFIVFMMVRFLPGDVVDTILGETGSNDPELRAKLEEEYELTGNVPGQYVEWLGEVVAATSANP